MVVIQGKSEVQQAIAELFGRAKADFLSNIAGSEAKALYVALWSMNYVCGPLAFSHKAEAFTSITPLLFHLLATLRRAIDVLLEEGVSTIEGVGPEGDEFWNIWQLLVSHNALHHRRLLEIQNRDGSDKIAIENGEVTDLCIDAELHQAAQPWMNTLTQEQDWTEWYYTHHPTHRYEAGKLLEAEFSAEYGLEFSDLINIDMLLQRLCEMHLERLRQGYYAGATPLCSFSSPELMDFLTKKLDQVQAQKWLYELEYRPGKAMMKSPLLRVKYEAHDIYIIPLWVFTPGNLFFHPWVSDLLEDPSKSRALGRWSQGYGKIFEAYLDEKLRGSGYAKANRGKQQIGRKEFPEIEPWLESLPKKGRSKGRRKEAFEIDRVIELERVAFVVSCKARDFLFFSKFLKRDLLLADDELRSRMLQNLSDINEIYVETECVAQNQRVAEYLCLRGKILVPVLITSMVEPLSFPEIKSYLSRTYSVASVPLLTVAQFAEVLRKHGEKTEDTEWARFEVL